MTRAAAAAPVVLFDAACVLCTGMVRFVLTRERQPLLRFASIRSTAGQRLAAAHGLGPEMLEQSFAVLDGGRVLLRSDAALAVAHQLRAPWSMLALLRAMPRPLCDAAYGLVARNRFRLFSRQDSCLIVSAAQRHRFIGLEEDTP
jgi:predicted DCC family thiol-disulfide oxidoreductase YuxK